MLRQSFAALTAVLVLCGSAAGSSRAWAEAPCQNTQRFDHWLASFRKEAREAGIKPRTISRVLDDMTLDKGIIARDRRQSFFSQSFLSFSDKLATKNRVVSGQRKLKALAPLFAKTERTYGVPGPVIAAFWALESDFGAGMGNLSVLRSLATLAYDCRRPERFRGELMAALKIIDRGDLQPEDMIGSWAGELGQTQFLPSHYLAHAVDEDGDGRRDLLKSDPDVVASSAAFLKHLGWRAGEPWLEEVRVPERLAWDQADLAIQHPRSQWAKWGVTRADGRPLPKDAMPASLLLMMGRHGPAFLAYPNFRIYLEWNQSLTYATTAAYLATRIAGAKPMHRGREKIPVLSYEEGKHLQRLLVKRGHDVGEVDGKIGALTRAAVKKVQLELHMPADSYATPELLERLRRR
ncbi:MAG: lytic murein transglycosylase [Hyphomicrobiaceae bacterium]